MKYHIIHGITGAIIIVTLSPVDPRIINIFVKPENSPEAIFFVKFIALAIIGGYAGNALLESSASQYSKRIDALEESEKENKKVREAISLTDEVLTGVKLSGDQARAFHKALQETSSFGRSEVANRADENRRQNWRNRKDLMERSIPIYEGLIDTSEAVRMAGWWGSLGYCLKDKRDPDFEGALEMLSKAIDIRDKAIKERGFAKLSGSYEINRAICRINLAKRQPNILTREWSELIKRDLDAAEQFTRFEQIIKDEDDVQKWKEQVKSARTGALSS